MIHVTLCGQRREDLCEGEGDGWMDGLEGDGGLITGCSIL